MQTIILVGGAGFIGSRLSCRLSKRTDLRFRIADIAGADPEDHRRVSCDVRDQRSTISACAGGDVIVNLAAVHRDDVRPRSLYDEVNVLGAKNVCAAARANDIRRIIFISSVAVYGFSTPGTDEDGSLNPFNDYGRTKKEAEQVFRQWLNEDPTHRSLSIIRPTVVFGERNRGNVYNLLKQIASRFFVMIGDGTNRKSMAYVENVAAFIEHSLTLGSGEHISNYVDGPDLDMNTLVSEVRRFLGARTTHTLRIPYWLGYSAARILDAIAWVMKRNFAVSGIRVKKFCSSTEFVSRFMNEANFTPPVDLIEALRRTVEYEFKEEHNERLFLTE